MIGSIKGKIILKTDKFLIVETGGVGYKISVSPDTLSKLAALRLRSGQKKQANLFLFGFILMYVKTFWIFMDF